MGVGLKTSVALAIVAADNPAVTTINKVNVSLFVILAPIAISNECAN